jgi:hypothetical protein
MFILESFHRDPRTNINPIEFGEILDYSVSGNFDMWKKNKSISFSRAKIYAMNFSYAQNKKGSGRSVTTLRLY